ncbi:P-loop containing nucleoside triphosphate hydrolase protein [Phlyctochytrium arcticum]|nr:P-loop containing nucleoside triphosphate hydrolase protein [Phlyctochytrium arcticum]
MDEFDQIEPAEVIVSNLSITIGGKRRKILQQSSPDESNKSTESVYEIRGGSTVLRNVSFGAERGKLVAIMGGSGSGKTTLLNALAGRGRNLNLQGNIMINGIRSKDFIDSGKVAYVQQTDQLLPFLTVRQTLQYAARLRLPQGMPLKTKYTHVENVILELGLKECADTIIGDEWQKGISGGEKRRVSVGVQLLMNPSILFMDEPTTGLDAFTSHALTETLVSLCRGGRTIFVSIHQPRSDIFDLFDDIILLSRGDLVYAGPRQGALAHFENLGHTVPEYVNPADHLIDITSVDNRDTAAEAESLARVDTLVKAWRDSAASRTPPEFLPVTDKKKSRVCGAFPGRQRRTGAGFWEQTKVLSARSIRNLVADRVTLYGSIIEVLLLATAVGIIFYKLDETQAGILGRKAVVYISAAVQNYLAIMFMVYKLSLDFRVFDRERLDKMYGVVPYLTGWWIANFLLNVVVAVIFSVILYYMSGLRTDEGFHFAIFAWGNILMQLCTVAWAFFAISIARDFATASLIANSVFTFLSTSSGFYIQINEIPVYLRWFKDISYISYGYRLLSSNEFSENSYACPDLQLPPGTIDPRCQGVNILRSQGFTEHDYWTPTLLLILNFFILMIVSALILSVMPAGGVQATGLVAQKRKKVGQGKKEDLEAQKGMGAVPRVDIRLDKLSLSLKKGRRKTAKNEGAAALIDTSENQRRTPILQSISAHFPAGNLSVILGASGAGKSTLLNLLMARPLDLGPFMSAEQSGEILYANQNLKSAAQVASLCSLVVQSDNHLLPALTARETLRFAALLRLPTEMSRTQKLDRAESVMVELGLKDCADRLVGEEGVSKGLSGGEKRRLSIGIQLLTNPAVLIIDEPTSGLDAYTSHNLMILLKRLASEHNRTVIVSIHQPRSDIVRLFDHTLLLARGGRPVYSGPAANMIPYFGRLGFAAPRWTNPADYAIDLSSVDLRNQEVETTSRERVDRLVREWEAYEQTQDGAVGGSFSVGHPSTVEADTTKPVDDTITPTHVRPPTPPRIDSKSADHTIQEVELSYRKPRSFFPASAVLINRSFVNLHRQIHLMATRMMQALALGVILTLYFARLKYDQLSVQSRFGFLQQGGPLIFIGMLNCIAVFPREINLMRLEYRDNIYGVTSFFVSYLVNEVPFEIVTSILYTMLAVYAIGLQTGVSRVLSYCYVTFCLINTGESIGIAFCALVQSIGFSVQVMSTFISLQVMMSGFLSVKMPGFLDKINYASIARWMARLTAKQEFEGLQFSCTEADVQGGTCYYRTGDDAMALLGFENTDREWRLALIMIAVLTVAMRGVAWLVLKYKFRKV